VFFCEIQQQNNYTPWYLFYLRYNRLSRHVRELAKKIKDLDPNDPFRTEATAQLLEKL